MPRSLVFLLAILFPTAVLAGEWKRLPSLPDKEGFAGSFAGVSGGPLLCAGGANFPGKKPWEGGMKVWHDTVFVLEKPAGEWKVAGRLPRPLGYGVSVTHRDAVVCAGGSDKDRHHADTFRLEWKAGKLVTTRLPPLPKPVANCCGALVDDTLYLAGGQEKSDSTALATTYRIDLAARAPRWEEIRRCPGPGRILAAAAGFDGAFWVAGGVELVRGERRYLRDAYRFDPGKGWTRVADLPHAVAAAPSPAPSDASGFYLLGGDDGSQVGAAPSRHRGFSKNVLRFDRKSEKWVAAGDLAAPRVTVPFVHWGGRWVVPSGEVRPGVRSPEVWATTPARK